MKASNHNPYHQQTAPQKSLCQFVLLYFFVWLKLSTQIPNILCSIVIFQKRNDLDLLVLCASFFGTHLTKRSILLSNKLQFDKQQMIYVVVFIRFVILHMENKINCCPFFFFYSIHFHGNFFNFNCNHFFLLSGS